MGFQSACTQSMTYVIKMLYYFLTTLDGENNHLNIEFYLFKLVNKLFTHNIGAIIICGNGTDFPEIAWAVW